MKIYVFCCSSSFDPDELTMACDEYGDELKIIPLPCSGKIDILYLTKAFETGADGVAVVTCKKGECRYLEGNLRVGKRIGAVEKLLEEIGLGNGRAVAIEMDDGGLKNVIKELHSFRSKINALPGLASTAGIPLSKAASRS